MVSPKTARRNKPKTAQRSKLYKTYRWQKIREFHLANDPMCSDCDEVATEVHHKRKHYDRWEVFADLDNLISLCGDCHRKRTSQGE